LASSAKEGVSDKLENAINDLKELEK